MTTVSHLHARLDQLRRNPAFETFVIAVIILSAIVVGAKTFDITPGQARLLSMLDIAVTLFFLTEISIRFLAEKNKKQFFRDGWNVFDSVIVLVSIIPLPDADAATVGRLIRVFRVLRMVSIVPELRMLINSLIRALPRLGYLMLLMFIVFYIFAAAGSTLFASVNPVLWEDVAISMLTLFRIMTFEDWTDIMYETMAVYPWSWAYYLVFISLSAFAFLNMVIGVIVGVIDEEGAAQQRSEHPEATLAAIAAKLDRIESALAEQRSLAGTESTPARDVAAEEAETANVR